MSTPNEVLDTALAPQSIARDFYDLKARGKWVLIRMLSKEERRTAGGIVVSMGQAKTQHGIVEDVSSEIPDLHAGDMVVFTNFVNDLEDVEELTGRKDLYLVRDEEVYSRAVKITDPAVIAELNAKANERFVSIAKEYEEATKNANA